MIFLVEKAKKTKRKLAKAKIEAKAQSPFPNEPPMVEYPNSIGKQLTLHLRRAVVLPLVAEAGLNALRSLPFRDLEKHMY